MLSRLMVRQSLHWGSLPYCEQSLLSDSQLEYSHPSMPGLILCSHCTTISLPAFSTSPVIPQTPGASHSSVSIYLSLLPQYLSFHQLLPHQLVICLHLHSSCVHFIVHSSSPCKSDAILFPPFPDFFLLTQHLSTFVVLTILSSL